MVLMNKLKRFIFVLIGMIVTFLIYEVVLENRGIALFRVPESERASTFSVMKNFRVFLGYNQASGQTGMLAEAQRSLGINSRCGIRESENFFGYNRCDQLSGDFWKIFKKIHKTADIFHIYVPLSGTFEDILMLRAMGKCVVIQTAGDDVRLISEFVSHSPYHYMNDYLAKYKMTAKEHDERKLRYTLAAFATASGIIKTDEETPVDHGLYPVRHVLHQAFAIGTPFIGQSSKARPLLVHLPSNPMTKGSSWIQMSLESLSNDATLAFDYKIIMPPVAAAEVQMIWKEADIVVDQLRIGWFGCTAVDAMALGKVVVLYLRPGVDAPLVRYQHRLPVVNATRETLVEELRKLIQNRTLREEISEVARNYAVEYHNPERIAMESLAIYRDVCLRSPASVNCSVLDSLGIRTPFCKNGKWMPSLGLR